jgi:hypothetical protein
MDSCGHQTLKRQKPVFKDEIDPARTALLRKPLFIAMLFFLSISLLTGCATTFKFGSPPRVNQLGDLKQGISTKAEVKAALGEPRGYGAARSADYPQLREIWYYDYVETDGSRMNLKFLLVFFDKDRYDAHMWFASAGLMDTAE